MMFGGILLVFVLFMLLFLAFDIITSVWAYRDARSKGRSPEFALIVLIGTLFFPILGLIVYVVIRNERF